MKRAAKMFPPDNKFCSGPRPLGDANLLFDQFISENCMENEMLVKKGRGHPLITPNPHPSANAVSVANLHITSSSVFLSIGKV